MLVEIDIPQYIFSLLTHSELVLSKITFWVCAENVCLKVDTWDWTLTFCIPVSICDIKELCVFIMAMMSKLEVRLPPFRKQEVSGKRVAIARQGCSHAHDCRS